MIKKFVVQGDSDDWKRAYVCGICWVGDTIAINTQHLRILTAKCKSSINNLFQMMGYGTVPPGSEPAVAICEYFSELKDQFSEMRRWTVRKKMTMTPTPVSSLSDVCQAIEAKTHVSPMPPGYGELDLKDDIKTDNSEGTDQFSFVEGIFASL